MADALDKLSAAELRTKLAEYGLPLMPITASTRGLMLKKLRLAMQGQQDRRKTLARYSSGEDSDLDKDPSPAPAPASKRHTHAGNMLPPATTKRRTRDRRTPHEDDDTPPPAPVQQPRTETVVTETVRRQYITRPSSTQTKEYDTGSDSEVDLPAKKASASAPSPPRPVRKSTPPKATVPPRQEYSSSSVRRTIGSTASPSLSAAAVEDLNSIRARLGLSNANGGEGTRKSSALSTSYRSTVKTAENGDEYDSPYLSSFARRLSHLKERESAATADRLGAGTGSGPGLYSRYYERAFRKKTPATRDFRTATAGEKSALGDNLVSLAIVGLVIAFFAGLSFVYLGMKTEETPDVPLCSPDSGLNRPRFDCVKESDVGDVLALLKTLEPELKKRAVNAKCGSDSPAHMTRDDVISFTTRRNPAESSERIVYWLYNLHVVLLRNQLSPVSVVDLSEEPHAKLETMTEVAARRERNIAGLEVLNPPVSWTCVVYRVIHSNVRLIGLIAAVVLCALAARKLRRMYVARKKERADRVYAMVERIIDAISQDSGDGPSNKSIPVSHVRDMLIAPQDRDRCASIWAEAIRFLGENESRVRFEVDRVAGEEYETLRWVSPNGSPRARGAGARAWQGQAFETQRGSVNDPIVSPTPCLKIRHMIDGNDRSPNRRTVVRDVILEKCGPKCRILHVEIDDASLCVYVKCASPEDAGVVYRNLHGWWYEGNLITVKYLRLERYMNHFPDSPSTGPYLKPSTQ